MYKILSYIILISCLASCIIISDDNGWWNKGYADNALVGDWRKTPTPEESSPSSASIKVNTNNYLDVIMFGGIKGVPQNTIVRTINIGKLKFLLQNSSQTINGIEHKLFGLIMYEVESSDKIVLYDLDLYKNNGEIAKKYGLKVDNLIGNLTPTLSIEKLDDAYIKKFDEMFSDKNNLKIVATFSRLKNKTSQFDPTKLLGGAKSTLIEPNLDDSDLLTLLKSVKLIAGTSNPNESRQWNNPITGISGSVSVAQSTEKKYPDNFCKILTQSINIAGKKYDTSGKICYKDDIWIIKEDAKSSNNKPDGSPSGVVGTSEAIKSVNLPEFLNIINENDKLMLLKAAQSAFEVGKDGKPVEWSNPNSGNSGQIKLTRTYQDSQGRYCREFSLSINVGGKTQQASGTAYRQPDGSWKITE